MSIDASNNFGVDSFRNERIVFLKELASNPDFEIYDLSDRLSIQKEKVNNFLRTYFKIVAQTTDIDDRPTKDSHENIRSQVCYGVNTEFGELDDKDIDNLFYVYDKYKEKQPDLYTEAREVRENRLFPPRQSQQQAQIAHDSSSSSSIPQSQPVSSSPPLPAGPQPQVIQPNLQPQQQQQTFNVDRLNKGYTYDFLYTLSRIGLLRFVLEGLPYPPASNKIEGFIQFFELNQDDLMSSPDILRQRLMSHFGDKTGDQASVAINSYIRYLKPSEGFGQRKISGQLRDGYFAGNDSLYSNVPIQQPQQQGMPPQPGAYSGMYQGVYGQQGPRFQDQYNTFYHAEMVLPYGMSIYSEDAKRLIREWEEKKKRKKEYDEKMNELMDQVRQKMSFSWAEMFDAKKMPMQQQGGGGILGPDFLQSMVAMSMMSAVTSGKMVALPFTDESGKMSFRLQPNPDFQGNGQQQQPGLPDPNQLGIRDILAMSKEMYESIDRKRDDAMQFKIETLKELHGTQNQNPITQIGETMKALKEVVPGLDMKLGGGGGGSGDVIETARIMLERDKFHYDRERTDKLIDQQWDLKKMEREHEMEAEEIANKTRNTTIKTIGNTISSTLPILVQVVMALLSMRNPKFAGLSQAIGGGGAGGGLGGGLGDIIGSVMKNLGGGGGGLGDLFGGGGTGAGNDTGDEEDEYDDDEEPSARRQRSPFQSNASYDDENDTMGSADIGSIMGKAFEALKGSGLIPNAGQQQQQPQQQYQQQQQQPYSGGIVIPQPGEIIPPQRDQIHPSFRNTIVGNPNVSIIKEPQEPRMAAPVHNIYESLQGEPEPITEDDNPSVANSHEVITLKPYRDQNGVGGTTSKTMYQSPPPPNDSEEVIGEGEYGDEGEEDEEEDDYEEYTPDHFRNIPKDKLRELYNEGMDAKRSNDSYLESISAELKRQASENQ